MQWPTTELVFPLFPTLLLLLKKRAAPDTHGLAISVIYGTDSISSMSLLKSVLSVVPVLKIMDVVKHFLTVSDMVFYVWWASAIKRGFQY
jgi:hypothetical protein